MSHAISAWREKLESLQQQEAILADPAQKFAIAKQIAEAKAKIAELKASAGGSPTSAQTGFRADISRIDKYAPAELIGREAETQILTEAWAKAEHGEAKRPRVLTFVALGGEGKTSLVARWVAELASHDWPGCEAAFAWSFYSQGSQDQVASSDLFLKEALTFFGDSEMAGSAQGAFEKGRRLAQLVGARRALLILDGLEPLQYGPTSPTAGELKDQGLSALLKGLAATSRGLCVVTTRYSIPNLKAYWQTTAQEVELKRLSTKAGVALLTSLGVKGSQAEYEKLVEDVRGHALTLNLLGTYLRDAHAGDIRRRDLVKLEEADAEEQGGHAFRVMDAYAHVLAGEGEKGLCALALLSMLGLFDRPATADCLEALWQLPVIQGLTEPLFTTSRGRLGFKKTQMPISVPQRNVALKRLEDAKLLSANRDASGTIVALDAHPLLREYFALRLRRQQRTAWRTAHKRIYEHLCKTTKEGEASTLEELQPLYQAVVHGCLAGLHRDVLRKVYLDRIARGNEAFSVSRIGAYNSDLCAIACFFEIPWYYASPALEKVDQAWLMGEAGYRLRAVGRLTEALIPLRAGLEMAGKTTNWAMAAGNAINLSELDLSIGEVEAAVGHAKQAMVFADRSRDQFLKIACRATLANALHQHGHWSAATECFLEAEATQIEYQPQCPLLYSLSGFHYCDILLRETERKAWQWVQNVERKDCDMEVTTCLAVAGRATKTLSWWSSDGASHATMLDEAFDRLTLGRTNLYISIFSDSAYSATNLEIEKALECMRRSGAQHHLPRGLLTRAWHSAVAGQRTGLNSARADLDEAREIAERGPMPLFMADIHLYRARLFFRESRYPWVSPRHDLAEARRLIEKHGYGRRKEELEDAERFILIHRENP